ncbi:hypothetical protein ANAPC5_01366 [Anaplasma phagocytophilum]|nr:hypothetical protein ANAPC5_01366 [Anaplasma phagocytophilum]
MILLSVTDDLISKRASINVQMSKIHNADLLCKVLTKAQLRGPSPAERLVGTRTRAWKVLSRTMH